MKKLCEFTGDEAFCVVARLMGPVFRIASTDAYKDRSGKKLFDMVSSMLENSPGDMAEVFAVLNETTPEEYAKNAGNIFQDSISMIMDDDLMELFGLRSKTAASSGSASGSTKGQKK